MATGVMLLIGDPARNAASTLPRPARVRTRARATNRSRPWRRPWAKPWSTVRARVPPRGGRREDGDLERCREDRGGGRHHQGKHRAKEERGLDQPAFQLADEPRPRDTRHQTRGNQLQSERGDAGDDAEADHRSDALKIGRGQNATEVHEEQATQDVDAESVPTSRAAPDLRSDRRGRSWEQASHSAEYEASPPDRTGGWNRGHCGVRASTLGMVWPALGGGYHAVPRLPSRSRIRCSMHGHGGTTVWHLGLCRLTLSGPCSTPSPRPGCAEGNPRRVPLDRRRRELHFCCFSRRGYWSQRWVPCWPLGPPLAAERLLLGQAPTLLARSVLRGWCSPVRSTEARGSGCCVSRSPPFPLP